MTPHRCRASVTAPIRCPDNRPTGSSGLITEMNSTRSHTIVPLLLTGGWGHALAASRDHPAPSVPCRAIPDP